MNDLVDELAARLGKLELDERARVLSAICGIVAIAAAADDAALERVHDLVRHGMIDDARDVIQDWQARRLLAQALPDWDFGDPNSGDPNGG